MTLQQTVNIKSKTPKITARSCPDFLTAHHRYLLSANYEGLEGWQQCMWQHTYLLLWEYMELICLEYAEQSWTWQIQVLINHWDIMEVLMDIPLSLCYKGRTPKCVSKSSNTQHIVGVEPGCVNSSLHLYEVKENKLAELTTLWGYHNIFSKYKMLNGHIS